MLLKDTIKENSGDQLTALYVLICFFFLLYKCYSLKGSRTIAAYLIADSNGIYLISNRQCSYSNRNVWEGTDIEELQNSDVLLLQSA